MNNVRHKECKIYILICSQSLSVDRKYRGVGKKKMCSHLSFMQIFEFFPFCIKHAYNEYLDLGSMLLLVNMIITLVNYVSNQFFLFRGNLYRQSPAHRVKNEYVTRPILELFIKFRNTSSTNACNHRQQFLILMDRIKNYLRLNYNITLQFFLV